MTMDGMRDEDALISISNPEKNDISNVDIDTIASNTMRTLLGAEEEDKSLKESLMVLESDMNEEHAMEKVSNEENKKEKVNNGEDKKEVKNKEKLETSSIKRGRRLRKRGKKEITSKDTTEAVNKKARKLESSDKKTSKLESSDKKTSKLESSDKKTSKLESLVKKTNKLESSDKKTTKGSKAKGMIFMCSSKTKKDCYRYKVLGLPASKRDVVLKIYKGMKLFLFDFDLKLLYGIYEAARPGGYNIEPKAFNSAFPSQVRFTVLEDCLPLPEEKFKNVIKDNYYSKNKFDAQLTSEQVKNLCKLFRVASKVPKSKRLRQSPRAETRTFVGRERTREQVWKQEVHPAFRWDRRYPEGGLIYEREPLAPPPRDLHLPPPSASVLPPPSYASERTLETDVYRRDLLHEHHEQRILDFDLRRRDEIALRDRHTLYRDRPSYQDPSYSVGSERYPRTVPPPEFYPSTGQPSQYQPPTAPPPEFFPSTGQPTEYRPPTAPPPVFYPSTGQPSEYHPTAPPPVFYSSGQSYEYPPRRSLYRDPLNSVGQTLDRYPPNAPPPEFHPSTGHPRRSLYRY